LADNIEKRLAKLEEKTVLQGLAITALEAQVAALQRRGGGGEGIHPDLWPRWPTNPWPIATLTVDCETDAGVNYQH
jgi:hypothetical protein